MEYVNVGVVTSTHGLKGEIKIKSDFPYKKKVFVIGGTLYLGESHEKCIIESYRVHKDFDMVVLDKYNDINQVMNLLQDKVYVLKDELNLNNDEYLPEDFIGLKVLDGEKEIGTITSVRQLSKKKRILVINDNNYLPFEKEFIKHVDFDEKIITISSIKGMF